MATNSSLVVRLVSASVMIANRAGSIIRDIMKAGDLGVVHKDKVRKGGLFQIQFMQLQCLEGSVTHVSRSPSL